MAAANTAAPAEAPRLADQLERSFHGGAWHGPALAEILAGIDAGVATQRPVAAAHTIAEIVRHVAFWLDGAARRIGGDPVSGLAPEEDWPAAAAGTPEEAWRASLAALEAAHRRLHGIVARLDDVAFDHAVAGSDPTLRGMLLGILQHTAYHAGQIQVLARAAAGAAAGESR
jgi:hypothetical protein